MNTPRPDIGFTPNPSLEPVVVPFHDQQTSTFSYVVRDPASDACAVIDSVMNLDYHSGRISYTGADEIISYIQKHQLRLEWIIETHVHADHLSAAPYIHEKLGGKTGIGEHIVTVQEVFGKIFNEGTQFQRDGSQFDRLFKDGDSYQIGTMTAYAMLTPGHTPACMTHVIGNAAFVGDTLFMPDAGTARADFPGGDAATLYHSTRRILELPPQTRLFMCHDYQPDGRELEYQTTVEEQHKHNIHIGDGITQKEFVEMRESRDATLDMPVLILPSLQVNMRAGHMPPAADNGVTYLKVPINVL